MAAGLGPSGVSFDESLCSFAPPVAVRLAGHIGRDVEHAGPRRRAVGAALIASLRALERRVEQPSRADGDAARRCRRLRRRSSARRRRAPALARQSGAVGGHREQRRSSAGSRSRAPSTPAIRAGSAHRRLPRTRAMSGGVGSASGGEMTKAGRSAGLSAASMKGSSAMIRGAVASGEAAPPRPGFARLVARDEAEVVGRGDARDHRRRSSHGDELHREAEVEAGEVAHARRARRSRRWRRRTAPACG